MAEPSLPHCQRLVSALKQANLYSSAGPSPAGQTIYTAGHKHLKLGLNLIYCYSLPVVWHLMSPKTLLVIGLIHKYELLFLCCLIIKRIKFCLWLLFIISKGNIIHRCLTLKTRHSLKFSCNTNTQDGTNTQLQTRIAHTHTLFFLLLLCSFSHTDRHTSLFLTVSSRCCLIYSVASDPGWAELDGLLALMLLQLVHLQHNSRWT